MEKPTRGERLLWAVENTDSLARDSSYLDRVGRFLQGFSDEIRQNVEHDDIPLLLVLMRIRTDGKAPPCGGILLQDRMVVLWSTGLIRSKTHIVELEYDEVTSVSAEGTDSLTVHANAMLQFSGFDTVAPIMRDIVGDVLQQRFEYKIADSGFVNQLSFTEIGITLDYQD